MNALTAFALFAVRAVVSVVCGVMVLASGSMIYLGVLRELQGVSHNLSRSYLQVGPIWLALTLLIWWGVFRITRQTPKKAVDG